MRKKPFILVSAAALLTLIASLFVSCGGGSTPSAAAIKSLESIRDQNLEALMASAAPEMRPHMEYAAKANPDAFWDSMRNAIGAQGLNSKSVMTVTEETIDGDRATVKTKIQISEGKVQTGTMQLVRIDGSWYTI